MRQVRAQALCPQSVVFLPGRDYAICGGRFWIRDPQTGQIVQVPFWRLQHLRDPLDADGYTYAGLSSRARCGIAATVSLERVERVGGHFAVWTGVDGETPEGRQLWVQVGVKEEPGDATPRLYLETVQPGQRRSFADLGPVATGQRVRVGLLRTGRGWVAIASSGVYGPFRLPAREATVTAEALAGAAGSASAAAIQVAGPHGAWARLFGALPLRDKGWKLRLRRDGFEATGVGDVRSGLYERQRAIGLTQA